MDIRATEKKLFMRTRNVQTSVPKKKMSLCY